MIRYHVPSVTSSLKLERKCPHCHRPNGRIHSAIARRLISDPKIETITQRRMMCPFCKTTWIIRPEGVGDGRQRTDRLICISVVLYILGLSYRGVEQFLTLPVAVFAVRERCIRPADGHLRAVQKAGSPPKNLTIILGTVTQDSRC
jgi:hypothetical protein